jgi:hypothetical protein
LGQEKSILNHNQTNYGWLPKLVQTVWTAKSGPNLDQIWTKSGPGFLKTDAEIPDKILRPCTRESLLKIVANKKVCEIR